MTDAAAGTPHGARWRDTFVDMGTFTAVLVAVLGALAGLYIQVHAVEVRVAVIENELVHVNATLKEFRAEQKQMRDELKQMRTEQRANHDELKKLLETRR